MSTPKNRQRLHSFSAPPARPGFTIVEMLITLGVITVLMGLLLTGLRAARATAHEAKNLSNLRQTFVAWTAYGNTFDDACIPGFLDTGVQGAWKVKYRDKSGTALDQQLTQTYTWRLLPYLDFNPEPVLGYLDGGIDNAATANYEYGTRAATMPASIDSALGLPGAGTAFEPNAGYNAYYLGGWWEMAGSAPGTPTMKFIDAKDPTTGGRVTPVARTISSVSHPTEMVAFANSTFCDAGTYKGNDEKAPGCAWIVPPYLAEAQIWSLGVADLMGMSVGGASGGGSSGVPSDPNSITVYSPQGVPLRRFVNVAITAVDGGQRSSSYSELTDMRTWTNRTEIKNSDKTKPVHTVN